MRILRLGWLGTATAEYAATRDFFSGVLGLAPLRESAGFTMLQLPSGDRDYLEIFGIGADGMEFESEHYLTGPVIGFVVDDLVAARAELAAAGIELVGKVTWPSSRPGYGWFHFRAPDGNLYAMVQDAPPPETTG